MMDYVVPDPYVLAMRSCYVQAPMPPPPRIPAGLWGKNPTKSGGGVHFNISFGFGNVGERWRGKGQERKSAPAQLQPCGASHLWSPTSHRCVPVRPHRTPLEQFAWIPCHRPQPGADDAPRSTFEDVAAVIQVIANNSSIRAVLRFASLARPVGSWSWGIGWCMTTCQPHPGDSLRFRAPGPTSLDQTPDVRDSGGRLAAASR